MPSKSAMAALRRCQPLVVCFVDMSIQHQKHTRVTASGWVLTMAVELGSSHELPKLHESRSLVGPPSQRAAKPGPQRASKGPANGSLF